jgi:hypothetical protein
MRDSQPLWKGFWAEMRGSPWHCWIGQPVLYALFIAGAWGVSIALKFFPGDDPPPQAKRGHES